MDKNTVLVSNEVNSECCKNNDTLKSFIFFIYFINEGITLYNSQLIRYLRAWSHFPRSPALLIQAIISSTLTKKYPNPVVVNFVYGPTIFSGLNSNTFFTRFLEHSFFIFQTLVFDCFFNVWKQQNSFVTQVD